MKKKIIFTIPALKGGGAEKVFADLVLNINDKIFDVIIIIFDGSNSYLLELVKKKYKIINLNKKKVIYGILKFINLVNFYKPDYIFSTMGNLNVLICIVKIFFNKKIKIITRETNFFSHNVKQNKFSFIWKVLYKLFLKRTDQLIVLANTMKIDLAKNCQIPKKKIRVIYNPVNFKLIKKLSNKRVKNFFKKKNTTKFLACGSLSYKKGFDILLDSLRFVKNHNYQLLILGSGPEEQKLKKKVKQLSLGSKVKFVKFIKNPYPIIKKSDCLIIPSRFEGCSNVMLESLYLKKPVISVPCPGANVEILSKRKNCLLSSNCSSESLANTITDFLNNKMKKRKTNLEKVFDTSNILKKYEKIILKG